MQDRKSENIPNMTSLMDIIRLVDCKKALEGTAFLVAAGSVLMIGLVYFPPTGVVISSALYNSDNHERGIFGAYELLRDRWSMPLMYTALGSTGTYVASKLGLFSPCCPTDNHENNAVQQAKTRFERK